MKIHELIWPKDRIDHIALHKVAPEEVEEVCFSRPLIQRAKAEGQNPVYYVLARPDYSRSLLIVCGDTISRW